MTDGGAQEPEAAFPGDAPVRQVHHVFGAVVWHPALRAGVQVSRVNGMHALRHFYASALPEGKLISICAGHQRLVVLKCM